jgi:hypothetical protein
MIELESLLQRYEAKDFCRESMKGIEEEGNLDHVARKPIEKSFDGSNHLMFTIPLTMASQFDAMFKEIDVSMDELNLKGYQVRSSTLEEVFISIG